MATLNELKAYLSVPGKPVTMTELKELSKDERTELLTMLDEVQS